MKRWVLFLGVAALFSAGRLFPAPAPDPRPAGLLSAPLSPDLETEVDKLEGEISSVKEESLQLDGDIRGLEEKAAALRKSAGREPGVLDEMRLKIILNDLKPKLER